MINTQFDTTGVQLIIRLARNGWIVTKIGDPAKVSEQYVARTRADLANIVKAHSGSPEVKTPDLVDEQV